MIIFGDTITALSETAVGIDVTFACCQPQQFDLVIGADGIHSNVRRIAFGAEDTYVKHLGYQYAIVDLAFGEEHEMYNEPGRMALLGGKAPALFVFASAPYGGDRNDVGEQKRFLKDAYRGGGWKIPALMERVSDANDFYMDAIARVVLDRYACGRVALSGDAAYGGTFSGFGTGLAVVAPYVLPDELCRANGDHKAAFQRYEARYRKYASGSQHFHPGRFMAPATNGGIWARNLMLKTIAAFEPLIGLVERPARTLKLDEAL